MTKPYTYLLKFKPTGQVYYGVRFKEGCTPEELFVTYFSSSKIIAKLLLDFGSQSFEFEIRKIFFDKRDARNWEQKVLTKMNAASDERFLNQSNNMKGILRAPGSYSWYYNSETNEKLLLKNSTPLLPGFERGVRGPDKKQKGTVVAYNILTNKQKKFKSLEDIPVGWEQGRPGGTTTNTKWIYNDKTEETRLIIKGNTIPVGWKLGNKNTDNAGRIKIYRQAPYTCKSIKSCDVDLYLKEGWLLGNPKSIYYPVFRLNGGNVAEIRNMTTDELNLCDRDIWYRGIPVFYRIKFYDGSVLTYPIQWFVKNKSISKDMIYYTANTNGKSNKYKFYSCCKIDTNFSE